MKTKRSQEAYLLIDHRNSPGITPEFMSRNGLSGPAVGAGLTFESAMHQCCGCGADILIHPPNPSLPKGEWCFACDAYMCSACALRKKITGEHKSMRQQMVEIFDKLSR